MSDRASYDPFAPRPLPFPVERLERAGVDEGTRERLAERYDELSADRKRSYVEQVSSANDADLLARYTVPADERLDELTVPQLADLLAGLGQPVSGTKPELLARVREHRPETPQEPAETPDGTSDTPEDPEGPQDGDDGADDPEEQTVTQPAGEQSTPVTSETAVLGEQPDTAPPAESTESAGETPEPQK